MPLQKRHRGFTLTELLLVFAMLALLIALVFPIYRRIDSLSRQTKCLGNLRSYGTALLAYVGDRQGLPVWNGKGINDLAGTTRPAWEQWTRPYLHKTFSERLRCPNIPLKYRQPGASNFVFNYGGNSALCIYYPTLRNIPVPANRTVFAAETRDHEMGFNHVVHFNGTMWGINEAAASGSHDDFENSGNDTAQYHGTKAHRSLNLFFLDGHVAPISPAPGKDWRDAPVYGTPQNQGYFYDRNQFKAINNNPSLY